ncbi:MAG: spore coat protein U domain-containing protein [Gemmatimonadota bacterium]
MRKRTVQAAIIVMFILAAGAAAAADTATVAVSARVVGTCRFNSGATLAFGDLPFDTSGNALGIGPITTTLSFWCTNGASYTITDDEGLNEVVAGSQSMNSTTLGTTEYIPYSLTYSPATGTGLGPASPITLTLSGTVGAVYATNTPDTYTDTVTLTIDP